MKEKVNKIESYINEIEQFDNNDIQDSFDIIHDKINKLLNDSNRVAQVALAEKTWTSGSLEMIRRSNSTDTSSVTSYSVNFITR